MDLSHIGATPTKPQAVQVTCQGNTRSFDRADVTQLKTPDLNVVDPNNPGITYISEVSQPPERRVGGD